MWAVLFFMHIIAPMQNFINFPRFQSHMTQDSRWAVIQSILWLPCHLSRLFRGESERTWSLVYLSIPSSVASNHSLVLDRRRSSDHLINSILRYLTHLWEILTYLGPLPFNLHCWRARRVTPRKTAASFSLIKRFGSEMVVDGALRGVEVAICCLPKTIHLGWLIYRRLLYWRQ